MTIEIESRAEQPVERRLHWLALLLAVWLVAVVFRLLQLQVVQHEEYVRAAHTQQEHAIEIRLPRGTLTDRNGETLAISLPSFSACVNPRRIKDHQIAAEMLGSLLQLDKQDLYAKMMEARDQHRGFLWVKRGLTDAEYQALRGLREGKPPIDWIEFRTESRRSYPKGELAAHVVGSVDHDQHGNSGIEQKLNSSLGGRPGAMRLLTDVRQRGLATQIDRDAVPGEALTLTLDERIQHIAERALVTAAQQWHAETASAIVINPHTGDILALANYPSFDPNQALKSGESLASRLNLAVAAPYEPGSIFKMVTMAAALETTRIRPKTMINCPAVLHLPGRVIHEAKFRGLGTVPAETVFAKSSNVGTVQIGLQVGRENMYEYMRRFGFGARTGVPLPGESRGVLHPLKRWQTTSLASVAIGHEVNTTAMQLARACAVAANGGLLVQPRLILRRQQPGEPALEEPVTAPVRIIRAETAITLRQLMEGVVLNGTGKSFARVPGYSTAGKTGTAQIFRDGHYTSLYNASFMGFAPVANPKVVVVVTLNGVREFGGKVSGPVFREITGATLRLMDVPRDLPDSLPEQPVETEDAADLAITELSPVPIAPLPPTLLGPATEEEALMEAIGPKVPNFTGKSMRTVLRESAASGVPVEFVGNGIARLQMPPPGGTLVPGRRVRIHFAH